MMDMILKGLQGVSFYPSVQTRAKRLLVDVILFVLGVAFEVVARNAPEMKKEIADWEDGRRSALGVLPNGPYITIEKRDGAIHYLGKGLHAPDCALLFKNLDSGILTFTGIIGSEQAVAENRIILKGSNSVAMELNRAMAVVEMNLFPMVIMNHISREKTGLSFSQFITKLRVYAGLVPAIVRHLF
ncbi:MAG: hypothetical protein U9P80_04540 [Thermodesulfobacteriota bacterium]|nr:hypothetical protein [Thermodesulfobacteriota bacterium]